MIDGTDWEILSLWHSRQKDTRDIAIAMKISEAEVANRLHRAKEAQLETHRFAVRV